MHRGSSKIYWCILDLPQHVSASHCHHQGVVVTSEATQAISVLWLYSIWIMIRPVWSVVKGCNKGIIAGSVPAVGYSVTILKKYSVQLSRCNEESVVGSVHAVGYFVMILQKYSVQLSRFLLFVTLLQKYLVQLSRFLLLFIFCDCYILHVHAHVRRCTHTHTGCRMSGT
jgi:hypothetical protein